MVWLSHTVWQAQIPFPLLKLAMSEPCPELGVVLIHLHGQFNRMCGCSCISFVPELTHTCWIVLCHWPVQVLLTGICLCHRTLGRVAFRLPHDLDWQTSPWEVKLVLSGEPKETKAQKLSGNKAVSRNKEHTLTCIRTKHWNYFLKTVLDSCSHSSETECHL